MVAGHWGSNKDLACASTPGSCNPVSLTCWPPGDPGCEPRSTPRVRRSCRLRQQLGAARGFLLHLRPLPPPPTMTIPGLEHMAAKAAALCILLHLHGQVDLTLHLRIRVHAAQVNPAVDSWRAQALTFIKHLPCTRHQRCIEAWTFHVSLLI